MAIRTPRKRLVRRIASRWRKSSSPETPRLPAHGEGATSLGNGPSRPRGVRYIARRHAELHDSCGASHHSTEVGKLIRQEGSSPGVIWAMRRSCLTYPGRSRQARRPAASPLVLGSCGPLGSSSRPSPLRRYRRSIRLPLIYRRGFLCEIVPQPAPQPQGSSCRGDVVT